MSASPWTELNHDQVSALLAGTTYVQNELIVALKSMAANFADVLAVESARDAVTATTVTAQKLLGTATLGGSQLYQLTLDAGANFADTLAAISNWTAVDWAAPNFVYTTDARDFTPNDPGYALQYQHATMQNNLAWDISQGSGVIVAVTDDGIDWDHADLAANIWNNADEIAGNGIDDDANGFVDDVRGWDFSSNDNNPDEVGGDYHGTHVAGIIAAVTNNATGVAGTAGRATIMPIRFYGSGLWTSTVIFNSYKYAADNGAKIISTSYDIDSFANDPTFASAVNYAYSRGVLEFNSAGNNGQLDPVRANYDQMLFVASTDDADLKSSFSNYGRKIDIAAPGENILSTTPGDTYAYLSGTSMATPNAAAVAALIWSAHPTWTRDQVAAQLLATADNIDALNPAYAGLLGTGRVDSFKALTQTIAPPKINGVTEVVGATVNSLSRLTVQTVSRFDEATVESSANWELRSDGADGVFDTSDDQIIALTRATDYMIGSNEVVFNFSALAADRYRFTAKSGAAGLKDPFGAQLDGDADGTAGGDYIRTFTVAGPISVVSTTPVAGSTVAPPLTAIDFDFDRAYLASSISAGDLVLSRGTVTGVTFVDSDTVRFNVSGLASDGALAYSLAAGSVLGTDGSSLGAFSAVAYLFADLETPISLAPLGPTQALALAGSTTDAIAPSDVDTFTLTLAAGQSLSLALFNASSFQGRLSVAGPGLNAASIASVVGQSVLLQNLAVASQGVYTITVDSVAGYGTYTLQALVDATAETESFGGPADDSLAAAQDLAAAWIAFAGGARAVVNGAAPPAGGNLATIGFETGSLPAGWTTYKSLAGGRNAVGSNPAPAAGNYALYMDAGTTNAYNLNEADWSVNLAGLSNVRLKFSQAEWNDEEDSLPASFTGHANGDGVSFSVDGGTTWYRVWNPVNQSSGAWNSYTVNLSTAAAAAGVILGANTKIRFQQYDNFAISTDGRAWDQVSLDADSSAAPDDWYKVTLAANESLTAALYGTATSAVFELYDSAGNRLAAAAPFGSSYGIAGFQPAAGGDYYLRVNSQISQTYQLVLTRDATLDSGANDTPAQAQSVGGAQFYVYGAASPGDDDYYLVRLSHLNIFIASSDTPSAGAPGSNALDPAVDLYDSAGNLIVSGDDELGGRNAFLSYIPSDGLYRLRVRATEGTSGTYILTLSGVAPWPATVAPLATTPAAGSTITSTLNSLTVDFSDQLLLSSLSADDLTVNGVAATSFTVNSGKSVTFAFTPPANGTVNFAIASGALLDLRGAAVAPLSLQVNYQLNGAPVLDNSSPVVFTPLAEDSPSGLGMLVSALLATGAGGDPITDSNPNDPEGIAVTTAANTFGTWQYSLDGGANWNAFGSVSPATARLLAADSLTRIRFVPNANFNGSVTAGLTFRAWDQTSGVGGGTADVGAGGGTTAFSTAAATADITVTPVNDAPNAVSQSLSTTAAGQSITLSGDDGDAGVTQSLTFAVDVVPAHGTLSGFDPVTGAVVYTPNAGYFGGDFFKFTVTDDATAGGPALTSIPGVVTIVVNPTVTTQTIPLSTRRDSVYDAARNALWVTTSDGKLNRYDATTGALVSSLLLGSSLNGLDITADGRYLYVADGTPSLTQGYIYKLDLFTGARSTITYALASGEAGAWNLKTSADGKVFFTTGSASGAGVFNPLHVIDVRDDSLSSPRDIRSGSLISRSADGNVLFFTEANMSTGPIFTYDSRTGLFSPTFNLNATFGGTATAVSRDGALVAMETTGPLLIRNAASLAAVTASLPALTGGAAFDPLRDWIYAVNASTDKIEVYNVNTGALQFSFAVGQDAVAYAPFNAGVLTVSDDGRRLFLSTSTGIRIFDLGSAYKPLAGADNYTAVEGTALQITAAAGVLANDQGLPNTTLSTALIAGPRHGTLALAADGSFTYTAAAGYTGFDTFTYRAGDGTNTSNIGYVAVFVRSAVNGTPLVAGDERYVLSGSVLTAAADDGVLSNDSDPDRDPLIAQLVAGPAHGGLTLNSDGSFTYIPAAGFAGTDTFTYRAVDSFGAASQASVTLHVVPTAPGTLIASTTRRDLVYDAFRNILWVTTTAGTLDGYDASTGALVSSKYGGNALSGADITPDGRYIYAAEGGGVGQAFIRKFDLVTGQLTTVSYDVSIYESVPLDLEISADGKAFVTGTLKSQYNGGVQLRVIDTLDDSVSTPRSVIEDSLIARGADRNLLYFTESDTSTGPTFTYDARTGTYAPNINAGVDLTTFESAVNRNSTLIAHETATGIVVLDADRRPLVTLTGLTGGLTFDPSRDILYAVDPTADQVVAISTVTWKELYRRSIGENVGTSAPFGSGVMAVSDDGTRLFLSTASGIRMFDLGATGRPQIGPVGAQSTLEDTPKSIDIMIFDSDTPPANLIVTAVSSNPSLVPDAGLSVSYVSGDQWRLSVAPASNLSGTATVTVTVSDGTVATSSVVTLNVTAVNDAPSFTKGADQNVVAGDYSFTGWATNISPGPGETGQTLSFLVSNDNAALFSVQPTINASGKLSYSIASGAVGTATVTVRLKDGGGTANGGVDTSAPQTFTVTAVPGLLLSPIKDQTILEDGSTGPLFFSASNPDLPNATITVSTSSSDGTLVPAASRVVTSLGGGNYQLVITPPANLSGTAVITVTAGDGTSTRQSTFTLTVNAVNDAPSFVKGADQSVAPSSGPKSVSGWATAISAGPSETGQTLSFEVAVDDPSLFTAGPSVSSNGTLTYTPGAVEGTAVVKVRLKDSGGTAGGGVDTSAWQTFTITIGPPMLQPGALDNSFDGDGMLRLKSAYGTLDVAQEVALQSTGKMIVVGNSDTGAYVNGRIYRLNVDGSLDTTFGAGGSIAVSTTQTSEVDAVKVLAGDKILVAGARNGSGWVARYNADGTLDSTFGTGGQTTVTLTFGRFSAMAIQADGKIVAAGDSGGDFAVARLNADGTLDSTFGTAGKAIVSISTGNDYGYDVAVRTDGKIVVVGYSFGTNHAAVARLNADGTLDAGFDGEGILSVNIGTFANGVGDTAYRVALVGDKILLGGADGAGILLARLNNDGSFDTTFDGDGKLSRKVGTYTSAYGMELAADGRILVTGWGKEIGTGGALVVARFNADGSYDTSFATDGAAVVNVGPVIETGYSVLTRPDGKIVVVGSVANPSALVDGTTDYVVVRLNADGLLDTTLGGTGFVRFDGFPSSSSAYDLAVQPDGKTVAVGYSLEGTSQRLTIWRTNFDGTLDTSFGTGGYFYVATPYATNDDPYHLLLQTNGKIVAIGLMADGNDVLRLNADGTLDTTFGGDGYATIATGITQRALAQQVDGKIIVVGDTASFSPYDVTVARLNIDGTLDTGFAFGGSRTVSVSSGSDAAEAVAVQADGKILIATTASSDFGLIRLNADGTLDTSFGVGGVKQYGVSSGLVRSIALQADGKIVVAGSSGSSVAAIRVNTDGTLDTTFDGDGKYVGPAGVANGVKIQADGKIVLAGNTTATGGDLLILRLNNDGTLDTSFDGDGKVQTAAGPGEDIGRALAIDSGRIIVAGQAATGNGNAAVLVRYFAQATAPAGPVISNVAPLATNEDTASASVLFSVSHPSLPTASLTVTATSGDTSLVSDYGLNLVNLGGGNYRLQVLPVADRYGSVQIKLTVTDGVKTATKIVTLTINPVNDAPSFVKGADQALLDGSTALQTVAGWANAVTAGAYEPSQALTFEVTNDNHALFVAQPAIAADGTLSYSAAAGARGTAVVTVRLKDDGGTASGGIDASAYQTFTISIGSPPVITALVNASVDEDASTAPILFTVADGDGVPSPLVVTAASSDATLLPPASLVLADLGGGLYRLVVTPAADRYGTAVVTVTVADGPLFARSSFTLTVDPVNDVPSFVKGADLTIARTAGPQTFAGWATGITAGAGEATQSLSFEMETDDPTMFAAYPTLGVDGALRFTPSGVLGTAVVRVRLRDSGGTAAGGVDVSPWQTFTITVNQPSTFFAGGSLDPTFYGDGVRYLSGVSNSVDSGRDVLVQADGKYVVAGYFSSDGLSQFGWGAVRYNVDGSLDTSFGTNGKTLLSFENAKANRIIQTPDGKFLIAGDMGNSVFLVRLQSDGTLDASFGGGGPLNVPGVLSLISQGISSARAVAVQADGKILVAGYTGSSGSRDLVVWRFKADGRGADSPFGTNGLFTYAGTGSQMAFDMVVRADGKIVVAGHTGPSDTANAGNDALFLRLNTNGTLDTSFGTSGAAQLNLSAAGTNDMLNRLRLQADGKLVAVGQSNGDFVAVRLTADGLLDTTFDADGVRTVDFGGTDVAYGLAIDASGRLVIAGSTTFGNNLAMVRLNADGSLDTGFDGDGKQTVDYGASSTDQAYGAGLTADGRIVVAGEARNPAGDFDVLLSRFQTDGSVDTTLAGTGTVLTNLALRPSTAKAGVLQADGKLIVGGSLLVANGTSQVTRVGIWRLNVDGSLDFTFGNGGMVDLAAYTDFSGEVVSLAVQPDGRILFGIGPSNVKIGRLNADGTRDNTFGSGGAVTLPGSSPRLKSLVALASGGFYAIGDSNNDFYVARFTSAGALDTTWDGDGSLVTPIFTGVDTAYAGVVQADGKLVVTGSAVSGTRTVVAAVRYLADGALDASFDGDGIKTFSVGAFSDDARAIALQADGRIVLSGITGTSSTLTDLYVARLNTDGSLDSAFGTGGFRTVGNAALDRALGVVVQADGKIVAAGDTRFTTTEEDLFVVRVDAAGNLDSTYGTGGKVVLSLSNGSDTPFVTLLQPDGRTMAVGTRNIGVDQAFAIRFMAGESIVPPSPLITPIADRSILEDGTSQINFTLSDPSRPLNTVKLAVATSDPTLLPPAGLTLVDLGGGNWRLAATPAADRTGSVRITVTASDPLYSYTETFTLTVNPVNDAPSFVKGEDQFVDAGAGLQTIQQWAKAVTAGPFENTQGLTFEVNVDDPSLFSVLPTVTVDGTLTFAAADGKSGTASVTVRLHDTGGTADGGVDTSAWQTFTIRILSGGSTAGELDQSFGADGVAGGRPLLLAFEASFADNVTPTRFESIVRQGDGTYLAGGVTLDGRAVVARFLSDGTLDVSFAYGGYAAHPDNGAIGAAVALRPDGKIALLARSDSAPAVALFNADGFLDGTFAAAGRAVLPAGFTAFSVAAQADGKILVGGRLAGDAAVVRFAADGSLDTSFDGDGVVTFDAGGESDYVARLVVQADGRIALAGTAYNGFNDDFFAARLLADGSLDTSFGGEGWVRTSVGSATDTATALAVQADGKIVVGGTYASGSATGVDWALVRYKADGTLDASFDGDGVVTYAAGGGVDLLGDLVLEADGRIIAAGSASDASGTTDTVVVRFLAGGKLDPTFAEDGVMLDSLSSGSDGATAVAVDPDGKVVAAGFAAVGDTSEGRVVRLLNEADAAPTVAGIYVRGSSWTQSYRDFLDATGRGSVDTPGLGYALSGGSTQLSTTLPWNNVDRITIRFDRDVVVGLGSLTLYDSSGQGVGALSYRYLDGRTVEFTVPVLGPNKYLIHIAAASVAGISDLALDGEWNTSASTWGQGPLDGSGDGTAGGDFNFRFNVLPGDFDSSGSVAFGEIGQARLKLGLTSASAGYDYRQDYDGSGSITFGEIGQARLRLGMGISTFADPTPPADSLHSQGDSERDIVPQTRNIVQEYVPNRPSDVAGAVLSRPSDVVTTGLLDWSLTNAGGESGLAPADAGDPLGAPVEPSEPPTLEVSDASISATSDFIASSWFQAPAPVVNRTFTPSASALPAFLTADPLAARFGYPAGAALANTAGPPAAVAGIRSQTWSTIRSEYGSAAGRLGPGRVEGEIENVAATPRFAGVSSPGSPRPWHRLRRGTEAAQASGVLSGVPSTDGVGSTEE